VTVLVVFLPNLAAAIEMRRSGKALRAAALSASAVGLSGMYEVWAQWSAMTYDRGAGSALAQGLAHLGSLMFLASIGLALLVLAARAIQHPTRPAA
jgi:hypothetical protein